MACRHDHTPDALLGVVRPFSDVALCVQIDHDSSPADVPLLMPHLFPWHVYAESSSSIFALIDA